MVMIFASGFADRARTAAVSRKPSFCSLVSYAPDSYNNPVERINAAP